MSAPSAPTVAQIREALATDRVIDITTIGRRSGTPRRIETWLYRADGRFFLTGSPGKRDWYANLVANPEFTVHLKKSIAVDLAATATPITDPEARREIITAIADDLATIGEGLDIPAWLIGSPLMEITFREALA